MNNKCKIPRISKLFNCPCPRKVKVKTDQIKQGRLGTWDMGQGQAMERPRERVDSQENLKKRKTKSFNEPENVKLLDYINDQIEANEKELECPVCLEVASVPIFRCEELHIICLDCRPKVKKKNNPTDLTRLFLEVSTCPECRRPYPRKALRHQYAERAAEELEELKKNRVSLIDA